MKTNISVLCKNQETLKFITDCFDSASKEFDYKLFTSYESIVIDKYVESSDLIVVSEEFTDMIKSDYQLHKIPILVMIQRDAHGIEDFDFESFSEFTIYDFLRTPFVKNLFINKVKLLVRLATANKLLFSDKQKVLTNFWNLMNYTNLYIIVLDSSYKIRLINYQLSKLIGFNSEEEAVGKNWAAFVPEYENNNVQREIERIAINKILYSEFTNDIVAKEGPPVTIKWFNSFINSNLDWIFSIGVPISKDFTTQDNIESVRAYYRDVITKDREMIKSIKEVTKNVGVAV